MSESQSRYSIVERLTQRKLEIMGAKSSLQEEQNQKIKKLEELKKDLENWNKDIEEDIRRLRRQREREIDRLQEDCDYTEKRLTEKELHFDNKIKAIEEALKSIETISSLQADS